METVDEKLWLNRISIASKIEVEKLAAWMIKMGYSTGHGNNMDDLLKELEWQITNDDAHS